LSQVQNVTGVVGRTRYLVNDKLERVLTPTTGPLDLAELISNGRPPGPPACAVWDTRALILAGLSEAPEPRTYHSEDYSFFLSVAAFGTIIVTDIECCNYTAGTGRSSKNLELGMSDAEKIQKYYSELFGIPFRKKNRCEVKSLVFHRIYYELPKKEIFSRVKYLSFAIFLDPMRYVKASLARLKRSVPWTKK